MTLLLTGGTGFIGRHMSTRLRSTCGGAIVRLVRNSLRPDFDERTDIAGDLANAADVERFVGAGTILVHLACASNPRSSNRDIVADLEQNLIPSARLFEQFAIRQPRGHVVFASTGGDMYSFEPPHSPRREEDPPRPQSSYSIHKLAAECYLDRFCQTYGIAGTILRIGNVYGDPIPQQRAHGLIGFALSMLHAQRAVTVIDPIDSVRDYLHLDDLAAAFQAVIGKPPPAGICRVLNLGSGKGHSIADIFAIIKKVTGRTVDWRDGVPPERRRSWNVLDPSRIYALTGWKAQIDLEEGIARLWDRIARLS